MPGGVFQLIAKNLEDLVLTDHPHITFFKTIYRRHTNFSYIDKKLKFKKQLTFGETSTCKILNLGDLVHKCFLVISIPEINTIYKIFTKNEILLLLNNYNITILFPNSLDPINNDDLLLILDLINIKITELTNSIQYYIDVKNSIITELNPADDLLFYDTLSIIDYENKIIANIMVFSNTNIFFNYINSTKNDMTEVIIYNLELILNIFSSNLLQFVLSPIANSLLHKIFEFISYAEFAKYELNISNNSILLYNITIDNIYQKLNDPTYTNLDSYISFKKFNLENKSVFTDITDIFNYNSLLISNMINNIKHNIKSLGLIFDVLKNDYFFTIYKIFKSASTSLTPSELSKFTLFELSSSVVVDDGFIIPLQLDTSFNFSHYYSLYINDLTTIFYNNIIELMSDTLVVDYFLNDITSSWIRLNINIIQISISSFTGSSLLKNVLMLNYIPLLTILDIRSVLLIFLTNVANNDSIGDITSPEVEYYDAILIQFDSILNTLSGDLTNDVQDFVYLSDDQINSLILNVNIINPGSSNIMFMALLKTEFEFNPSGGTGNTTLKLNIMEYIKQEYINGTAQFLIDFLSDDPLFLSTDPVNIRRQTVRNSIVGIINSFFTPIEDFPKYSIYTTTNNYRLFSTGVSNSAPIADVMSSIWYNIQNKFRIQFNTLFNNILQKQHFDGELGVELSSYLDELIINPVSIIRDKYKTLVISETVVDYYALNSESIHLGDLNAIEASVYVTTKEDNFNIMNNNYEQYKLLLNSRNISLNRPQFYYNTSSNILNSFISIIKNTEDFGYTLPTNIIFPGVNAQIDSFLANNLDNVLNTLNILGIMDIIDLLKNDFVTHISSIGNPFTINTDLHNWYEQFNITLLTPSERTDKQNEFLQYINWITPVYFYSDIINITSNYTNFSNNTSIYQYILDYNTNTNELVQQIKKVIIDLSTNISIINIYNTILDDLTTTILNNESILTQIDNSNIDNVLEPFNDPKLYTQIINSIDNSGKNANFAWIKELGHFLINTVSFEINNELMDEHPGEWLHIYNELSYKQEQLKCYNRLIGNLPFLYTFNNEVKPSILLYIPLQFWFCRFEELSLPLVSLQHVDISIKVKLKKLNEVAYWDNFSFFKKEPKLDCHIEAQYIYIENDERKRLSKTKGEHLVNHIQYRNNILFTKNEILFDSEKNGYVVLNVYIKNPCKEIIWFVQTNKNIDGSLLNGALKYDNYSYNDTDPLVNITIKFDNIYRENTRSSQYFNNVVPYEYHSSSLGTGKYVYSFSLLPNILQPSGSANISKIDNFDLYLTLNPDLVNDMINNNVTIRCGYYGMTVNILRVMSGMAGLAMMSA
jgi:hypothetical protein